MSRRRRLLARVELALARLGLPMHLLDEVALRAGDVPDRWTELEGHVCSACGISTSSSPCPDHQPAAATAAARR